MPSSAQHDPQADFVRLRTAYKADAERMCKVEGGRILFYGQTPNGIRTRDFGHLSQFLKMSPEDTARHVLALSHAERADLLRNFYDDKAYPGAFKLYQQIKEEILEEEKELEEIKTSHEAVVKEKKRKKEIRKKTKIPENIDPDLAKSSQPDDDDFEFSDVSDIISPVKKRISPKKNKSSTKKAQSPREEGSKPLFF